MFSEAVVLDPASGLFVDHPPGREVVGHELPLGPAAHPPAQGAPTSRKSYSDRFASSGKSVRYGTTRLHSSSLKSLE